jgi:hypothetical protein
MAQNLSDVERVLKLIERVRLLIAIDDEMPSTTKLDTQPVLKMLEAMVAEDNEADRARAAEYYRYLYGRLENSPDVEALLSAIRVFLPYLR